MITTTGETRAGSVVVGGCWLEARLQVVDLFVDLRDGKMLMKLLEIISGENLGRPNKGVLRVQKMENLNRCLTFLSTKVCARLARCRDEIR